MSPSIRTTLKAPPGAWPVAGLLAALTLAACSQAPAPPAPDEPPSANLLARKSEEGCLRAVWQVQAAPDREFDRENDLAEGGAISCATNTSASQFADAIETIRAAAQARDRDGIVREANIPLLVIDERGERRFVEEAELEASAFEEFFPPDMLEAMAQMDLDEMTVVPERGGYFELGSLWLVATETGGRPRLVTVNRQALNEAAESARRRAEAQQAEEPEPSA